MKKKQHITAFYLETLLMIVVFISIILVLTRVFGSARAQSVEAKNLTNAVTLAQNTAEAVAASRSPQELCGILEKEGNASSVQAAEDGDGRTKITALYGEGLTVETLWTQGALPAADAGDSADAGNPAETDSAEADFMQSADPDMAGVLIRVLETGTGNRVYTLQTAVYVR